jgi:hypothetical protein
MRQNDDFSFNHQVGLSAIFLLKYVYLQPIASAQNILSQKKCWSFDFVYYFCNT